MHCLPASLKSKYLIGRFVDSFQQSAHRGEEFSRAVEDGAGEFSPRLAIESIGLLIGN